MGSYGKTATGFGIDLDRSERFTPARSLNYYQIFPSSLKKQSRQLGQERPFSRIKPVGNIYDLASYYFIGNLVASSPESRVLRNSRFPSGTPRGKKMSKKDSFFYNSGECREHDRYECAECASDSQANTLSLAVIDSNASFETKENALNNYKKQTKFIKTALKLSDENLRKKKVTDVPELMKKAQKVITIGDMGDLLEEEYVKPGVIKRFVNFIEKTVSNNR